VTGTEQRWRAQVAAWTRSGLSCKEYAAKAGIHPGTLAGWKSKLGRRCAAGDAPADFVEVTKELATPTEPDIGVIELVVGNALLRVRGAVAAETLSRVLDVLEARA
jgi:hypothetical protein